MKKYGYFYVIVEELLDDVTIDDYAVHPVVLFLSLMPMVSTFTSLSIKYLSSGIGEDSYFADKGFRFPFPLFFYKKSDRTALIV